MPETKFNVHYRRVDSEEPEVKTVKAPNPDQARALVSKALFPTKIAITKIKIDRNAHPRS